MFRPVFSCLRSVVTPSSHLINAHRLNCAFAACVPRTGLNMPPPVWQSSDNLILPTKWTTRRDAVVEPFPAKPMFAPTSSQTPVCYSLPPAVGAEDAMLAVSGLRILRGPHKKKPQNMLVIKRIQMNKHRLKKFRKKYKALIAKTRMRREMKKEKLFRAELLAQIREAEQFDAESYVKKTLSTIAKTPKQESLWEREERFLELKRKYRSNVDLVRPKFEDPVK